MGFEEECELHTPENVLRRVAPEHKNNRSD